MLPIIEIKIVHFDFDFIVRNNVSLGTGRVKKALEFLLAEIP